MKLSKEQKDKAIADLSHPWGNVNLICDEFRISLQVQRFKGMTYRVVTFVNGEWKGVWMSAENSHPEQKFMRLSVKPLYRGKIKQDMEKIYGKRHVAKDPRFSKTITHYFPDFASGKAAINHMCKVSESIQIVEQS
jgi:hypothetical protein